MYWTVRTSATTGATAILRANLDRTQQETVISLSHRAWAYCRGFQRGGELYWMTGDPESPWLSDVYIIHRANLDGSQVETVFTRPDEPKDLAVNFNGGKPYWVESDSGKLQRANLDGSQVETLVDTGVHWLNSTAVDSDGASCIR